MVQQFSKKILESAAGPSTHLVSEFSYHTRGVRYRGVKNGPKMSSFVALYRKIDRTRTARSFKVVGQGRFEVSVRKKRTARNSGTSHLHFNGFKQQYPSIFTNLVFFKRNLSIFLSHSCSL